MNEKCRIFNINNNWYVEHINNSNNTFLIPLSENPFYEHPYLDNDLNSIKINAKYLNIYKYEPHNYTLRYADDEFEKYTTSSINVFTDNKIDNLLSGDLQCPLNVIFELDESLTKKNWGVN